MALDFRSRTVSFNSTSGGPQRETDSVAFGRTVRAADVALKGFNIHYDNGDHNIFREQVDIDRIDIDGDVVSFAVDFVLRDSSGSFDDPYSGEVEVLVIADVV